MKAREAQGGIMDTIETMSCQEATERLRAMGMKISPETVRSGLQQKVFPFGDYIATPAGNPVYIIYTRLFEEWAARRVRLAERDWRQDL